jgi:hypothetical protein
MRRTPRLETNETFKTPQSRAAYARTTSCPPSCLESTHATPKPRKQPPVETIETSLEQLQEAIAQGVLQKRIGALLKQTGKSGRSTAKGLKMNHAQLRKLEAADINLEVSSLVRVAHELEFDVTIRLEPRKSGEIIETRL